ncbi:hypothetical protein ES288_A07G199500v1 [Gossypium darwinii]|uniref:Transmembrane 9 superfamily member n=1 Tax=Gossypium darwinii TaxID=34276 RepID=A0A5D2FZ38_GOSDA|nr:hypothetical protein ES288_A07G199500v1 [Gossypium darwinii]
MERIRACLLALTVVVVCGVAQVRSSASDHRYTAGDEVPLYANKVGPFHNPSETYRFFDFPFCSSAPVKEKKEALGEVLNGDRLVSAPYRLDFLGNKEAEVACKRKLTKEEVAKFRTAVSKDYYFQMYYDDLPIWGFLGKVDKEGKADPSEYKYYLFKHLIFEILYNKDRVIEITVRSDPNALVDLTQDEPVNVDFMYTVKWKETETPFEKRMDKYSESSSMPHHLEIHWFSIINSCMTKRRLGGSTFMVMCSGGIAGKNTKAEFQAPCRTTKYPREIPPLPWYRQTLPQMAMAGFLPFSAIYIELYYIFSSVWGHRIYTIYSILFIVFIILLIVTAFVTVAMTYFQLAAEDHEWWWRSFLCGGSTGLFIYAYCLYYYNAPSDMSGFMQTSFFFGYMACICYGFFLMLGAIGFRASLFFVRHIYRSIKCE